MDWVETFRKKTRGGKIQNHRERNIGDAELEDSESTDDSEELSIDLEIASTAENSQAGASPNMQMETQASTALVRNVKDVSRRKIKFPASKAEYLATLWEIPAKKLAILWGCSQASVLMHANDLGLTSKFRPGHGYWQRKNNGIPVEMSAVAKALLGHLRAEERRSRGDAIAHEGSSQTAASAKPSPARKSADMSEAGNISSLAQGQPGAAAPVRAGLQPGQLSAADGAAPWGAPLDLDDAAEKADQDRAKVVRHSRQVVFQMAEVAVPRELFRTILQAIGHLRQTAVTSG